MKVVLVVGMQTSGISATALLTKMGCEVRCYDDKIDINDNWCDRGDAVFENLDVVVVSPGITNQHRIILGAKERGIPILSELDLGVCMLKTPVVMVTGTNGKTTTVDMINKGLSIMGKRSAAMGNIGYPASKVVIDRTELDYAVVEASSFQLEYTNNIAPKISVLLNIAPDHVDRYPKFDDYITAKMRVFLNQTKADTAILNYDSRIMRDRSKAIKSHIMWVSTKEEVGLFYIKNNYYYYKNEPLVSVKDSRLRGEHNKFNTMVAMNVMAALGARKEQLISLVRDYKLLPHRVEYVSTICGKSFYNDSKGTNIDACKHAINAVNGRVGLILGGSDKHEEFCEFFDEMTDKVSFVAVTGGNEQKIFAAAMKVGFSAIKICPNLKSSLELLYSRDDVDTILFSPASASFDRYRSYAERGDSFKDLVYAIKS
ncbi:MAG: UDP-N-acetylmuramoyl-L-alanine--D-glutamate ligase [Bacillota bacterium]